MGDLLGFVRFYALSILSCGTVNGVKYFSSFKVEAFS